MRTIIYIVSHVCRYVIGYIVLHSLTLEIMLRQFLEIIIITAS